MLADPIQLDRWRRLLTVPINNAEPGDRETLVSRLTKSRGRPFLTAAVRAIATSDLAVAFVDLPPLPAVPVRRAAVEGTAVADAVWLAYLHFHLGSTAAAAWLRAMIYTLAPTALVLTADDNPEPWWQAEMIILHAVHSFALRSRDRGLVDQTLVCADFHLREIQPDHATNEPWAVHAYASHFDGAMTAETLWHAAYIQHGGTPGPIARLLAADASASLAAWLAV